jgi:glycosyltransferase involved in cell wall biosynthesis
MKLGICANFGPPHCGGSEQVIKNISTILIDRYGYDITIFGYNYKKKEVYKGINLCPCLKGEQFISQIAKLDSLMVYSDSFWGFPSIIDNFKELGCKLTVVLVGAYYSRSNPYILKLLKKSIDKINLITHSSITPDYKFCIDNNFPVNVIPNGVDLSEFRENNVNFKEKYGIKNKRILLNIGNYFYGKGQEALSDIHDKLGGSIDDFVTISISSTVQYNHEQLFLNKCKRKAHGANIKFLRDIPREDVVSAFRASDIFLFTSRKEVAPLVILECRAAKLPYVSMDVGDISSHPGGILIPSPNKDSNGYSIIDDNIIKQYFLAILKLVKLKDFRESIIEEGQAGIDVLDWNIIAPLYHEVFSQ